MSKKIFYLHIPKNSGTTLTDLFKKNYKNILVTHWNLVDSMHHSRITYNEIEKFEVITGHYPYGLHHLLTDDTEYIYVTMLREPLTRLQSAYNYLRNDSDYVKRTPWLDKHLNEMSFDDFTIRYHEEIPNHLYFDNGQVRYLSGIGENKKWGTLSKSDLEKAKNNLSSMIFGITEKFDESVAFFQIQGILGNIQYIIKNEGSNQDKSNLIAPNNILEMDYELYNYALKIFKDKTGC